MGSSWQYYAKDRLGSVRQVIDPAGQLALAQTFDPFGNLLEQAGPGASVFGYTGEQTDPTDLVFLRARYYDPSVGRFLTADTIVPDPLRSMGWNGFAYVENNPVNFVDPSGHCNIRGGNLAVMEQMPCIGGGGPTLGKPVGGGEVVTTATLFTLATFLRFLLDSIAILQEEPLPHTPEIKPCSLDSGFLPDLTGDVPPFELPPYPAPRVPSLDDILDADPIEPGIKLPNVSSIERTPHGEERHADPNRPTSQAHQDKQNSREVYIDNDTGYTIYVGPKGRTHIFTPDGKHHTSFRTDRPYRRRKVQTGNWTRQQ